jgi:hypothetical protein
MGGKKLDVAASRKSAASICLIPLTIIPLPLPAFSLPQHPSALVAAGRAGICVVITDFIHKSLPRKDLNTVFIKNRTFLQILKKIC